MPAYRSRTSTFGRNMAGARALWRATGMKDGDFGKPIIAVVNSFTQFVPGHVHLKDLGQMVAREIEAAGGVAKEFNTIAIDDGIAMGHDGMLYSLPSRELIADSVEYMVNAHCADALVCISNCDKITPGMLMAALRLNIPTVFVSGGPMEAGKVKLPSQRRQGSPRRSRSTPWSRPATTKVSDADVAEYERSACPTCGSCSGMFTANSMNCLTEALGLSLPGNGTLVATHADRKALFLRAGRVVVELRKRYYEKDDASVLPRSIATFEAFENAMSLDVAMGGSTNTVLHLLACAHEAGVKFTMADIDQISRKVPCLCKVAPSTAKYHVEDVHRAGGIFGILAELDRAGLIHRQVPTVHSKTIGEAIAEWDAATSKDLSVRTLLLGLARRRARPKRRSPRTATSTALDLDREQTAASATQEHAYSQGRRPGRALRQPGREGLHREDGRRRRIDLEVLGQGARLREPRRRRGGHPGRQDRGRRRGGHPLRRPQGRPRHAGDALPHELSQVARPRQGVRPAHRRALLGRHAGPVHRPRLARGGVWRRHRAHRGGRHHRHRHPQPTHPPGRRARPSWPSAAAAMEARKAWPGSRRTASARFRPPCGLRRHDHQRRHRRREGRLPVEELNHRERGANGARGEGKGSDPESPTLRPCVLRSASVPSVVKT